MTKADKARREAVTREAMKGTADPTLAIATLLSAAINLLASHIIDGSGIDGETAQRMATDALRATLGDAGKRGVH